MLESQQNAAPCFPFPFSLFDLTFKPDLLTHPTSLPGLVARLRSEVGYTVICASGKGRGEAGEGGERAREF